MAGGPGDGQSLEATKKMSRARCNMIKHTSFIPVSVLVVDVCSESLSTHVQRVRSGQNLGGAVTSSTHNISRLIYSETCGCFPPVYIQVAELDVPGLEVEVAGGERADSGSRRLSGFGAVVRSETPAYPAIRKIIPVPLRLGS